MRILSFKKFNSKIQKSAPHVNISDIQSGFNLPCIFFWTDLTPTISKSTDSQTLATNSFMMIYMLNSRVQSHTLRLSPGPLSESLSGSGWSVQFQVPLPQGDSIWGFACERISEEAVLSDTQHLRMLRE